jgi:uncharacterized LabA/DUF88 family protein
VKKTYVYIDGFNFYYGAVKGTSYKWLNFRALCENLFSKNRITKIKYFTARVTSPPEDPRKSLRQDIYIQALKTLPNLEVVEGNFRQDVKVRPLAFRFENGRYDTRWKAPVLIWEEKGSDVNLGAHLVNDAWKNLYEVAIIISNDTDLVKAIQIVKNETRKPVGIVLPTFRQNKKMAVPLQRLASFHARITKSLLQNSQFPDNIPGTNLRRPKEWY